MLRRGHRKTIKFTSQIKMDNLTKPKNNLEMYLATEFQ